MDPKNMDRILNKAWKDIEPRIDERFHKKKRRPFWLFFMFGMIGFALIFIFGYSNFGNSNFHNPSTETLANTSNNISTSQSITESTNQSNNNQKEDKDNQITDSKLASFEGKEMTSNDINMSTENKSNLDSEIQKTAQLKSSVAKSAIENNSNEIKTNFKEVLVKNQLSINNDLFSTKSDDQVSTSNNSKEISNGLSLNILSNVTNSSQVNSSSFLDISTQEPRDIVKLIPIEDISFNLLSFKRQVISPEVSSPQFIPIKPKLRKTRFGIYGGMSSNINRQLNEYNAGLFMNHEYGKNWKVETRVGYSRSTYTSPFYVASNSLGDEMILSGTEFENMDTNTPELGATNNADTLEFVKSNEILKSNWITFGLYNYYNVSNKHHFGLGLDLLVQLNNDDFTSLEFNFRGERPDAYLLKFGLQYVYQIRPNLGLSCYSKYNVNNPFSLDKKLDDRLNMGVEVKFGF